MEQASFDFPTIPARRSDPPTSVAAAEAIAPATSDLEQLVLYALRARGDLGFTSAEIAEHLCMNRVTLSPRFRPLERKGLVADRGRKRNGGIVWIAIAPIDEAVVEDPDRRSFQVDGDDATAERRRENFIEIVNEAEGSRG